jgi:hypothetical protein
MLTKIGAIIIFTDKLIDTIVVVALTLLPAPHPARSFYRSMFTVI